MAAGITKTGTTLFVYDDTDTSGGRAAGPYTFAQISAAFPADLVDLGTTPKSYRALANIQIGDATTGTAATSIVDTGVTVFFDANFCLFTRTTQPSSWSLLLGTKIGSGNQASGRNGCVLYGAPSTARTVRGTSKLYGSTFVIHTNNVGWTFNPLVASTGSEIANCIFDSRTSGSFTLGTLASVGYANIYNADLTSSGGVGANVLANIGADAIERMSLGTTTGDFCFRATAATGTAKDVAFFGSPTSAHISLTGPSGWNFIRPLWISGVKKFVDSSFSINTINEMWAWQPLIVDRVGTPVSGIPVMLTDVFGSAVVNTTSDSVGRVTFGSGQTANMLPVIDYYGVAGITTVRQHGPYLTEINTGASANLNYPSLRYYWQWPNAAACTNLAGQLDDFGDAIPLGYAGGNSTTWQENQL